MATFITHGVKSASHRLATAAATALLAASFHIARAQHAGAMPKAASSPHRPTAEAPFLAENDQAMNKMMEGMNVAPTGNADFDFAAMMIPHHQGAVDMALAELRYGKNEKLRRIAQEIIVDQQQEIVAMRLAVGRSLPPSAPAPTQVSVAPRTPKPPVTMQMKGK